MQLCVRNVLVMAVSIVMMNWMMVFQSFTFLNISVDFLVIFLRSYFGELLGVIFGS